MHSPPGSTAKARFDPTMLLAELGEGRPAKVYRTNQIVFTQGDPADSLFYILKGKAKLTVLSGRGKEAVVAILKNNDFFGKECLAGQAHRMTNATATSDCSVMRIRKTKMLSLLNAQPAFAAFFLRYVLARKTRVEEDLADQLFNSSEKRLARALLPLANFGEEGEPERDIPKISQENLAQTIGTTRARVSFFMNKFRKLGFIKYGGATNGIKIHRSLLNVVLR